LTSVAVSPCTPNSVKASRTSSSLNGLMIAMTIFMEAPFVERLIVPHRTLRPADYWRCFKKRAGLAVLF
jgi:hypothetical protein